MYRPVAIATIANPYPNDPKLVCVQLVKCIESDTSYEGNIFYWVRLDLIQYYDIGVPFLKEKSWGLYGDKFYDKDKAMEQYWKMDTDDIETMEMFWDMVKWLEEK